MSEQSSKNNRPFGGYLVRLSDADDTELTRVGRGTPAGEFLRRFWQPVAMASELKGRPLPIRILGEDLVLFRDLSGELGLLHRHCSHRGTSLEFGIISDHGIRCCYHGWKYDVDGTILETPAEPENSNIRHTLCHGAYRTREFHGLIFAYMGPPEEMPPFPLLDSYGYPAGNRLLPYKLHQPCNWLQAHENGADSIHSAFLHADYGAQFTPVFSALPVIEFCETPLGVLGIAVRRWNEYLYVRASDVFLPNFAQFGSGFVTAEFEKFAYTAWTTRWMTPIDDTATLTFGLRHLNSVIDPRGESREDLIGDGIVDLPGQTDERPYADRQILPGDWDAQVSQGPIAIHRNENLGTTDRGIAMFRRFLRRAIRDVQEGRRPAKPQLFDDGIIPTYIHEVVIRVPERKDEDDRDLRRRYALRVSRIIVDSANEPTERRKQFIKDSVRAMTENEFLATDALATADAD